MKDKISNMLSRRTLVSAMVAAALMPMSSSASEATTSPLKSETPQENTLFKSSPSAESNGVNQGSKSSVKGRVLDEKGEPLIGATVMVKGTKNGTVTDFDGNFTLQNVDGSQLTVTYVGYKEMTVNVSGKNNIDITMKEDNTTLSDVVVVGYGTQKKANLTGSVSSVNVDDFADRPITNSSTLLAGTASGVYALQKSGQPGADDAVLNIRGVGTLNNSSPLVIIDGFPGSMSDVTASDIQSISVLKDAASSAIYGNRAANGVILITTKKGAAGKMSVQYNGYFGVQTPTSLPKTLNSFEYASLYNEANRNDGESVTFSPEQLELFKNGTDTMYPDNNYFDIYYHDANIQNHRLNVSGGNDRVQYAFMAGYLKQDGILRFTDYKKTDFRANVDSYFLNKSLRFTTRLSGNYGDKMEPTELWYMKWYATYAPIYPLKASDGMWMAVNGERNYLGEATEGSTRKTKNYTFNGQIEAEYKFLDGFSVQLTYGTDLSYTDDNAFNANVKLALDDNGGYKTLSSGLTVTNYFNKQTLLTGLFRYDHTFGKHAVGAMLGYSEEYFDWKWNNSYRSGFSNNTQREINLGDVSTQTNNSYHYDLGLRSYFGRVNYTYDNKYLFEANFRRDGSSRFADGNKWGTFPSFSAGWVLSEEPFMKKLKDSWLDFLKIRASWGKLGNQNVNSYYIGSDVLSAGLNYSLGGSLKSGVAITSLNNKQTTWETTTQTDIGVDLSFLNGFNVTLDYFIKKTDDILMQKPIPWTMGDLGAPYINAGKVENKGIEFALGYNKSFANGLKLRANLNLTHIDNKITDLNGASPIISSPTVMAEGHAINSFYGYIKDGVYQISDFTWQNNSDPSISHYDRDYKLKDGVVRVTDFDPRPGDVKYRDLNGDGVVDNQNDRTVIGKQFPDLSYGFSCDLEWKNFDLNMFWQGVAGIDGYTYYEIATSFSGFSNLGDWWLGRWTPENPTNKYPAVTKNTTKQGIHSTFYMEDASYLRLKNIELGYTFDKKILPFLSGCKVRLYANVQNALTFTSYKGFDPEKDTGETRAEAYPQTRVYTFGLNINF